MEREHLWEHNTYITPLNYISGRIVEYDIRSANITMLKKYGVIDENYYNYLANLPKYNREVEIGLLIKNNSEIYDTIKKGIIEAKKLLFEYNNIEDSEVVRIANDAVYINRSVDLQLTNFDGVEFVKKSISSIMLNLHGTLLFIFFDLRGNINIEIKGISKDISSLHQKYLLSFISNTIFMMERYSVQDAMKYYSDFYEKYIKLELDIEYYREFNSGGRFKIKNNNFYLSNIEEKDINLIDINYNLFILRELWGILLSKYNGGK